MATPIRCFEPDVIYFVTSRCTQSRLLMRPSKLTNEIIGAALARAVRLYDVEIFGFAFTSNHFHLLIRAKHHANIARFMQFLQSNIARKVGRLVQWHGRFFARRYSAEPVVDDESSIERLSYMLAHGVKEGLVDRCSAWPGLSALGMLKSEECVEFRWRDWTKRWLLFRDTAKNIDHFSDDCPTQKEALRLAVLPAWRQLSAAERLRKVEELEAQVDEQAAQKTLGVARILAQDPLSQPRTTKRSKRPKCHASTIKLWKECVGRIRAFCAAYRQASRAFLRGDFESVFPEHCFRPPAWLSEARSPLLVV